MDTARGFTLVEVMTAVSIIAILASIAFPAYQEQVRKAKRSDGASLLLDIAQKQERFNTDNGTYTMNLVDLDYTGDGTGTESREGYYRATVEAPGACVLPDCYRLLAVALVPSQINDGNLRLWSNGRKQRQVGGVWQEGWE